MSDLTSQASPLKTRMFNASAPENCALRHDVGGPRRERRRQQEAVAIKPVDRDSAVSQRDARQIIGIGRAHVAADLDNLGLREGRMDRVAEPSNSIIARPVMRPGSSFSTIDAPTMNSCGSTRGTI